MKEHADCVGISTSKPPHPGIFFFFKEENHKTNKPTSSVDHTHLFFQNPWVMQTFGLWPITQTKKVKA